MHLHLEPVGGIAGDMFVAAMLDAFPQMREPLLAALPLAGLPPEVVCSLLAHTDGILTGSRFDVAEPRRHTHRHANGHAPVHDHHHRHLSFRDLREMLSRSGLAPEVKRRAIAIFEILAGAEGKVHGANPDDVSFHEIGEWDSVADIVAAAFLIDALGNATWSVAPLPLGSGRVKSAHGLLPVPAPATCLLIEGFAVRDDGLEGERVTPTGAAILRHLDPARSPGQQTRVLIKSGIGFGTRRLPGISNILRVMVLEDADRTAEPDQVAVLSFEIDDQTGEDLAAGLARLRQHPDVIDVLQLPAFGKKGRMVAHVQILARSDSVEAVADACFSETSTLGVRRQLASRLTLNREHTSVPVDGKEIRVKLAERPDSAVSAKAEMDDVDKHGTSRLERELIRRAAESEALSRRKP